MVGRVERYMMDEQAILAEFRDAEALLEGHFLLSSGLHSPIYLQCARVLMDPCRSARLCAALAARIRDRFGEIDLVVSPAMGGVVVGYETARQLGARAIFVERVAGRFELRRGFTIRPGERIAMVEDVVTTGLSSRECIAAIRDAGAEVVVAASLVDRSGGRAAMPVPFVSLLQLDVPVYPAHAIPKELSCLPAVKPGSRDLR